MRLMDWIAICVLGPIVLAMVVLLAAAFVAAFSRQRAGRRGTCAGCRCDDVNLGWCDPERRGVFSQAHCRDCCADLKNWRGD